MERINRAQILSLELLSTQNKDIPREPTSWVKARDTLKYYLTKGFNFVIQNTIGRCIATRVITVATTNFARVANNVFLKYAANKNIRIWKVEYEYLTKNAMAGSIKQDITLKTTEEDIKNTFDGIKDHITKQPHATSITLDFELKERPENIQSDKGNLDSVGSEEQEVEKLLSTINELQKLYSNVYELDVIVNITSKEEIGVLHSVNLAHKGDEYKGTMRPRFDETVAKNHKRVFEQKQKLLASKSQSLENLLKKTKIDYSEIVLFKREDYRFAATEIKEQVEELREAKNTNKIFELDGGIKIIVGDITTPLSGNKIENIECIVNAANPLAEKGGGVSGAIAKASGNSHEWAKQQKKETGKKHLTPGEFYQIDSGKLKTTENIEKILHAVPPNLNKDSGYQEVCGTCELFEQNGLEEATKTVAEQLKSAYKSPYLYMKQQGYQAGVFPFLGTGVYHINPRDSIEAAKEAKKEVDELEPEKSSLFYMMLSVSKKNAKISPLEREVAIDILKQKEKEKEASVNNS